MYLNTNGLISLHKLVDVWLSESGSLGVPIQVNGNLGQTVVNSGLKFV